LLYTYLPTYPPTHLPIIFIFIYLPTYLSNYMEINPDTDSRSAIQKTSRHLRHTKAQHSVHKQQPASEVPSTHLQHDFSNIYTTIPTQLRSCLPNGPINARYESCTAVLMRDSYLPGRYPVSTGTVTDVS
jgi:hypothetical protein